jgi:hypothetical protein
MRVSCCLSACVICLLCSAVCTAQKPPSDCVGPLSGQTYQCDGPDGCHSQIVTHTGGIGDYFEFTTVTLHCCGQLFSSIDPIGDCDGGGLLRDPGTKHQIYLAAEHSPMLIADCHGRYIPYDKETDPPAQEVFSTSRNPRVEVGR